jgi:hypothetical protein
LVETYKAAALALPVAKLAKNNTKNAKRKTVCFLISISMYPDARSADSAVTLSIGVGKESTRMPGACSQTDKGITGLGDEQSFRDFLLFSCL